jgi:hypothetical protein
MALLAPKFGISDVALKKRCKNLGIPTPPRGYWAKLEAGKPVKRPLLPASWEITVKKKKREPQSAEEVWKFDVPDRDYSVAKLPSAVAATKRALKSAREGYYGVVDASGDGALRTKVAPHSYDRALWLWTELLTKLAKLGITVVTGTSSVTDGVSRVGLELKEMTAKYSPKKSPDSQVRYRRTSEILGVSTSVQQWAPTGVLVFRADTSSYSAARKWPETELRRMEDRLEEVATGMAQLLRDKHVAHLNSIEQQKRAEEARQRREEEEARLRHEQARLRKLLRLASSSDRALHVRQLAQKLQARADQGQREEVARFVQWARAFADQLDPVSQMLSAIENGKDPVEPEHEDKYPLDSRRPW